MGMNYPRIVRGLRRRWIHWKNNQRIRDMERQVEMESPSPSAGERPVVLFNASTRLEATSLNAAYALLTRWGLQLSGVRVVQFACRAGMSRCMLGTNPNQTQKLPPCRACMAQSRVLFGRKNVRWFDFSPDLDLEKQLRPLKVDQLASFSYHDIPLGELVLPGLRWTLRRHHLKDDEDTRFLFCQFIQSAWSVARSFTEVLEQENPRAVVVFNGISFPEATARWVARLRGIRVITHEVCHQPYTAFFHTGEATAYPIPVPENFELDQAQNERLDQYLEQRFKGNFSMAGIRFWPEIKGLDPNFLERLKKFRQVVPVFTNVIFDTSQGHANVVFEHMFAWMDQISELIRSHPETLFVIRAHPDEIRPGKASQESVAQWVKEKRLEELPNVVFVPSQEYFSSYELIQRSKFVMVYNSTIGIEAALMGAVVLCGGRARFTQVPCVFFPTTPEAHKRQAEEFLQAESLLAPQEFLRNARRFMYMNLYRACLPFSTFLEEDGAWAGFVRLKRFQPADLAGSPVMRLIIRGILDDQPFILDQETGN